MHWLLDNGHGNNTPGKRSPTFVDGSRLFEYQFTRLITDEIERLCNNADIKCSILVPEIVDTALRSRVQRANNIYDTWEASGGDVRYSPMLISIHGNAYGNGEQWTRPSGIETFHYPSSVKGRQLAYQIQHELIEKLGWRDRGIKTANFYILKYSKMPSVLTENGFYTNYNEARLMLDPHIIKLIAIAHFTVIQSYEEAIKDKKDFFRLKIEH